MSNNRLLHIFVLLILFVGTSFTAMCKNPVLKGTKWAAVQEMFVADAGTMTITHTLEFTSAKDVLIKESTYLPSHPAMYVNPDGTIDRIPASSSEREVAGTYKFRRDVLTITLEDGTVKEFTYLGGDFLGQAFPGGKGIFSRVTEEPEGK